MAKPKGGMDSNPFGGRIRLDRLELEGCLESNAPEEKMVFLNTIKDAVHNYLFFGLGRNGTTAEEFAWACEYLFRVRSDDPDTWKHARKLVVTAENEHGIRSTTTTYLSDEELIAMCFDTHFQYSNLAAHMDIDRFLSWLERERKAILDTNLQQVLVYMESIREKSARGEKSLVERGVNLLGILTKPKHPGEVAGIIYAKPQAKETVSAAC